jgi:hypothetical protein
MVSHAHADSGYPISRGLSQLICPSTRSFQQTKRCPAYQSGVRRGLSYVNYNTPAMAFILINKQSYTMVINKKRFYVTLYILGRSSPLASEKLLKQVIKGMKESRFIDEWARERNLSTL